MPGKVLHRPRPALRSGRFLHLAKLGPTGFLSKRNSPAPCGRENALGPPLSSGIRPTLASRKLFQDGNNLRKFINLSLRIPAILAEPGQRLSDICH